MRAIKGLLLLTVALSSLVVSQSARAQYPPPAGSITAQTASTTPAVGSNVLLTCKVTDTAGAGVANAPCTFTIVSEPGTDAAVGSKTITKMTDSTGVATDMLRTGSTPGVIVISITSGTLVSQVLVNVQGAAQPLPPASPVEITPPKTGSGGLAH